MPIRRGSAAARLLGLRVRNLSVVFCQEEVSASVRSLVQRSPTECGVSECDHEGQTITRNRVEATQEKTEMF
jgi:hypothetical protein